MDILTNIFNWISQNWVALLAVLAGIHELLTLIDKLLPEDITIDNHIADYIVKILKMLGQKKTNE